ncbi:conserved Plasmodium protein, unknown function [Plasmodium ovale wallikeri]|uniref:CID domain-containing protein n=2 Tax=Plasmodium ovale TaxID=36330 RepID=A0A1C3KT12_PLAOA|nr:conserved Plasmodium protein, unknown function [Plasmodium ovale wallikeri]SBT77285.1 conserved Plasmodium protein, unknown function [Plasmodium ovale]
MKYGKTCWDSENGKKKNEQNVNDDKYSSRNNNTRYNNRDGGIGYNKSYHIKSYNGKSRNSRPHSSRSHSGRPYSNRPSSGKFNAEKQGYTSFSSNVKSYNNYETKNKILDKRNSKNSDYNSSSYRKGSMNDNMDVPNSNIRSKNYSSYQKKYVRISTERAPTYNMYGANYKTNDFDRGNNMHMNNDIAQDDFLPNDNNYHMGERHMSNDGYRGTHRDNRGDHQGNSYNYGSDDEGDYRRGQHGDDRVDDRANTFDFRKQQLTRDLNNLHRDLHNMLFSPSKMDEDKEKDMPNVSSVNSNFHHGSDDNNSFLNTRQMKLQNEASKDGNSYDIPLPRSKESHDSVLSKLSILRNIPFNNSESARSSGGGNGIISKGIPSGEKIEQPKSSTKEKTAMIIDDLKKCLNRKYEGKLYIPSEEATNRAMHEFSETNIAKEYVNNCFDSNAHSSGSSLDFGRCIDQNGRREGNRYTANFPVNSENSGSYTHTMGGDNLHYKDNRYSYPVLNDYRPMPESPMVKDDSSSSGEGSFGDRDMPGVQENAVVIGQNVKNEWMRGEGINFSDNSIFPEEQIRESLKVLNTLQVDIERVCCYIKHFVDPPEKLFQVMTNVFLDNEVMINSKMAIFYVYNHLIQELKNNYRNNFIKYNIIAEKGLELFVIPILKYIIEEGIQLDMINKFYRCISIWSERNIYSKIICDKLKLLQKCPNKKINITLKNMYNKPHTLLSNELSKFVPLNFILKMPSINNEHKIALQDKILNALFNNLSKETLKGFNNKDIEEASKTSDKVMRIFGQELILINSQILELSSLITDNNEHLIKLQRDMEKLKQ